MKLFNFFNRIAVLGFSVAVGGLITVVTTPASACPNLTGRYQVPYGIYEYASRKNGEGVPTLTETDQSGKIQVLVLNGKLFPQKWGSYRAECVGAAVIVQFFDTKSALTSSITYSLAAPEILEILISSTTPTPIKIIGTRMKP